MRRATNHTGVPLTAALFFSAAVLAVVLPVSARADQPVAGDQTTTTIATPDVQVTPEGDLVVKSTVPAVTVVTNARHVEASFASVKWFHKRIITLHRLTVKWAEPFDVGVPSISRRLAGEANISTLKHRLAVWKQRSAKAHRRFNRVIGNRGYLSPGQARVLGRWLAAKLYHWTGAQWSCLDTLWGRTSRGVLESGWDVLADNPRSEAYGIPQANPGSKMSRYGANWAKSAYVQIRWGLSYIKNSRSYLTPCGALGRRLAQGWY